MNKFQIFKNSEFGEVRTVMVDGEPWFIGKDICQAFGDKNHNRSISRVDSEDKREEEITDSLGRKQKAIFLNESGLYSLLFTMQPQKANNDGGPYAYPIEVSERIDKLNRFKRWVTSEVLPSIRKNGGYIANQESLSEDEILANAIMVAKNVIEKQKLQLQEQAPKVIFADAVSASKTSILVGELAKLLKQNNINMGQNRLFDWLRTNGFLIRRKGTDYNMPTQTSMEMGLFEIKETSITHSDGHISVSKTPKVTGKGQVYFINKFLKREEEELA